MIKTQLKKLKGDRKYFAIVFLILILIFISGIVTPILVDHNESHWQEIQSDKLSDIQTNVKEILNNKQNALIKIKDNLKVKLSAVLFPPTATFRKLIELVNEKQYQRLSIEVIAPNGKLIAWNNKIAVPQDEIFPLSFPPGQTHFTDNELISYLSVTDTLKIENDLFYVIVSQVIEKHYNLQTPFFKDVSLSKSLSHKFLTQFEIHYNPFAYGSKDGRKYSFSILNNMSNKIGLVIVQKPSVTTSTNNIYNTARQLQTILLLIAILFAVIGFKTDYKRIKSKAVRLLFLILVCGIFRFVLYYIGFPSNLIDGSLVDPAYFSSAFGGGIVKSPIEFFVTLFFLLFIAIQTYRFVVDYGNNVHKNHFKIFKLIFVIPLIFLFLITIRGLSAAVRSIIFDSTLRYFKEPNLIPNLPTLLMIFNALLLGIAVTLVLCSFLILVFAWMPTKNKSANKKVFLISFFIVQILGALFIFSQIQPLINYILILFIISIIYIILYAILFAKTNSRFNYVYITLAASIISITLLNFFNLELERESLKTTALEINRPNDNLLEFLVNESLKNAAKKENVITSFNLRSTNFDALAFLIWSESFLQRETLNSSISIFDKNKNYLGRYSIGLDSLSYLPQWFDSLSTSNPKVITLSHHNGNNEDLFIGITPIKERDITIGYVSAAVSYSLESIGSENIPAFLQSGKNLLNTVLTIQQLKIFQFSNDLLTQVYGDIYPSRDQIKPILNAEFTRDNEAWLNLVINGENYLTYVLKNEKQSGVEITAVLVMKKHFTWNLFNFFKIFILHSIIIFILFLVLFIINFRKFKYSFRTQLLFSFLFISIVPVVVLAVYNHRIVAQRTQTAIFDELDESTNDIIGHVKNQLAGNPNVDVIKAFQKAGEELNATFTVYENSDLIFSSKAEYIYNGLFADKINPEAYYQLYYLNYREYLTRERIEDYPYNAFYRRVNFGDKNLVIGVNDAFNKVNLTFTTLDVDVFLFGIYSFAVIIIIIFSTILANRISAPIRKLTKATNSVAHGDLNVELDNTEKGELKELFEGFNTMTKELQENQVELAALERENAWREMAKQVAHEIKNPLTPMKLAVQQLIIAYKDKNKDLDSIFDKITKTILNQVESLNSIASEFSRFAKMPSPKLEEMDLLESIEEAVDLFTDEKVKINIDSTLPTAAIEADKSQFRRLLINLLRNSIQASATEINFRLIESDLIYQIFVHDNGKGIPAEAKNKIFDSNFTTKKKGMGLGLKLAKRFLESIDGDIELIDSSPEGTTFKITVSKFKPRTNRDVSA